MRRLVPLIALLASLVAPGTGAAAVSCAYDAGTARVTITLSAALDDAAVRRTGDAIGVGGTGLLFAPCGAATVRNTNQIQVSATGAGQQRLSIYLQGGRIGPGMTRESTGVSEIEFAVNLGTSTDFILVEGGSGNDDVRVGKLGANLNDDNDVDVQHGSTVESWTLRGNDGADRLGLQGGRATGDPFVGQEGPVTEPLLVGSDGNDVLVGGPSRETFIPNAGNDFVRAGGGQDLVYGGSGADRLEGGADGDAFYPEGGDDLMLGGAGRDYFGAEPGLDGADDFRGGPGTDEVSYFERAGALRVDLDGRPDDGLTGEGDNIRSDVEDISGGSGADRLVGNGLNNILQGNDGADRLTGLGGDDELAGGSELAADTLGGGPGNDFLDGGDGADTLSGGPDDDILEDGPGVDSLDGGGGDDTLDQGSATNGADDMVGGPGLDEVLYSARAAGVSVTLNNVANDGTTTGEGDNVRDSVEAIWGSPFRDVLTGNSLNNFFIAGGGNDDLFGLEGADRLFGDAGLDVVEGGLGWDYLNGGNDNDAIGANDGGRDEVDGGAGAGDDCNTDPAPAIDLVTNCEL